MLTTVPDDLATAFEAARDRLPADLDIRWFAEVDSTNTVALALAAQDAGPAVVMADAQRAGRGRRGRVWCSPPGAGLYLSIVVTGGLGAGLPLLTLGAGVAAAGAIASCTGLPVELKWPNDLVVGRPWRKLGGILCEAAGVGSGTDSIVVGIGINLRASVLPPDLAAIASSIGAELGRDVERAPLAVDVVARLFGVAETLRGDRGAAVVEAWRRWGAGGIGAEVRWQDRDRVREGRARGIADDGALLVECDGRIERIIAGEVTWGRKT